MTIQYPIIALLAIATFFATIALAMYFRTQKRNILARFASKEILPMLSQNVSSIKIFTKTIMFSSAIALLVFALARPQWGYKWTEQKQMGIDIIFAVDTSKSMLAEDIKPNRLERAKLAINDVIERLNGDRIGLVAFSGQAFLQCPITLDYGAFKMSLDALDTKIIQRGGTNIASAIDEADSAFTDSKNQKILILISDGEELEQSGIKRAEKASKEKGIKIYTLGVGLKNGEPIPIRNEYGKLEFVRDETNNLVSSKLNEDLLKQVANATDGIYANLSDNGMDTIYEEGLKKAPKAELSAKMKKIAIERFQIPLALALILLVLDFVLGSRKFFANKRSSTGLLIAVLMATFVASPSNLKASENEQVSSTTNVEDKLSPQPQTWQEFFNAGIDASENKKPELAKENFYKAIAYSHNNLDIHAKSYYNLGCVDFLEAKANFEKTDVKKAIELASQTKMQTTATLQSSSQVLKKCQDTLKNSGEEALNEQNLQNEIKGAINQCEQAKKAIEETEKSSNQTRQTLKKIQAQTSLAQKNFENASELAPEMQSAHKNLSASNNAIKKMEDIDLSLKSASENFTAQTKLLDKNIEELKKLLRDENKDNEDNQQTQQQNQDNKQDNNQQQNQNQDQQQDKNNQNEKQNNEQNSQDKNQEQQKQDSNKNQQKQENQNSNSQQDKQNNAEQKENQQKSESQNAENKKDEQAVNSNQENEKTPENSSDKKEENATPQQEENKTTSQPQQLEQAEEKDDGKSIDYRSQVGVMSRREATQVLDSLKDDEKKLPFSGYGTQRNRFEDKKYKDW